MSELIICATPESKSRKSRKVTVGPVIDIFRHKTFSYLYGPAAHPKKTQEKHQMALENAILAKKKEEEVLLILVTPNNPGEDYAQGIIQAAKSAGILVQLFTLDMLIHTASIVRTVQLHTNTQ